MCAWDKTDAKYCMGVNVMGNCVAGDVGPQDAGLSDRTELKGGFIGGNDKN